MSVGDTIFPFPASKSDLESLPLRTSTKAKAKKPVLVLDMGEASREEGFRLNGCR